MLPFSQSHSVPAYPVVRDSGLEAGVFYGELLAIADRVSELLMGFYAAETPLTADRKGDDSPVTAADRGAHALLVQALQTLTPEVPVLSEESAAADIAARRSWPACWLVDPLDGTREFLDRSDEFTCNVTLIVDSRPVIGLISVPVRGQHYLGVVGAGAVRCAAGAGLQGTPLRTRVIDRTAPLVALASARHCEQRVRAMLSCLQPLTGQVLRRNAGSAVKFCELLDGQADVYARTSPCYEWDVAAGDALVTAAGGRVYSQTGELLRYNARDSLLAERFIAAADASVDYGCLLAELLAASSDLSPSASRS